MGTKRSGARGSFVSSVTNALDIFYAEVVETIRPWTPPAPQLPAEDAISITSPTTPLGTSTEEEHAPV
jgi:hypothetical protein